MKIKRLSEILKENIESSYSEGANIQIEVLEDERSPKRRKSPVYSVNYQKEINGELFEIDGILKPKNTGRSVDYYFEPDDYADRVSEDYYDENWEDIEDEILKTFNEKYL